MKKREMNTNDYINYCRRELQKVSIKMSVADTPEKRAGLQARKERLTDRLEKLYRMSNSGAREKKVVEYNGELVETSSFLSMAR